MIDTAQRSSAKYPKKRQHIAEVVKIEQLTPQMVRVQLRVAPQPDPADNFTANDFTDAYIKLLFSDPRHNLTPPYDLDNLPQAQRPLKRTYTVRNFDAATAGLTVDFVTHGDTGIAGRWAQHAAPGDRIAFLGPGGKYAPDPDAAWHLLLGDTSALPAITNALAALPASATGVAILTVATKSNIIPLAAPENVRVVWDVAPAPGADPHRMLAALTKHALDFDTPPQVFAHGERENIKQVRRWLRDRKIPKRQISISGYWAYGRTEDVFQAEKQTPVGQID